MIKNKIVVGGYVSQGRIFEDVQIEVARTPQMVIMVARG